MRRLKMSQKMIRISLFLKTQKKIQPLLKASKTRRPKKHTLLLYGRVEFDTCLLLLSSHIVLMLHFA